MVDLSHTTAVRFSLPRFRPDASFVAAQEFRWGDTILEAGDPFDISLCEEGQAESMYDTRFIAMVLTEPKRRRLKVRWGGRAKFIIDDEAGKRVELGFMDRAAAEARVAELGAELVTNG